ncbi:hypothetical protein RZS08_11765, partial [Arthrospira platensis SPKY1]|nr:hypothetical protein [Arthrospira platensis SPKY1]
LFPSSNLLNVILSIFAANVLPLCAGGDFEKQINHGNTKLERTTQRNVTVKPRLCKMAVGLALLIFLASNIA